MGNNKNLERTFELTALLRRYPHLPTKWIGALLGVGQYHQTLLTEWRKRELVTNHRDSFAAPRVGLRPKARDFCWVLTPSGHDFNEDHGYDFVPPGGHFKHQLASSFAGASFELATKELPGLTYLPPSHVLMDYHCPDETRDAENPWRIGGKDGWEADLPLFGLRYQGAELYFLTEVDRSSETQAVIEEKLENYQRYLDTKQWRTLYGLKEPPYFPWILKHADRMKYVKAAIKSAINDDDQHRFIIKVQPETVDFPPPTGRMATEDWYTTDGLFNILTHLKGEPHDPRRAHHRTQEAHRHQGKNGGRH